MVQVYLLDTVEFTLFSNVGERPDPTHGFIAQWERTPAPSAI